MPANIPDKPSKCTSDKMTMEPMPVDKLTTFGGKLDQFLQAPRSPDIPTTRPSSQNLNSPQSTLRAHLSTTQKPTMAKTKPTEKAKPKPKANAKPKTTKKTKTVLSTTIATTRVTRSQSKATSAPTTKSNPAKSPISGAPITAAPKRGKRKAQGPSETSPAPPTLLRDTVEQNLILLLVGVNPGLQTYRAGFAYAHPSNLFWRLLHSSGITSVRHPPSDTYKLPELYGVGNTNVVERVTRDASTLTKQEMNEGVVLLEAKVAAKRPEAVCLVGKGIWEAVWRVRHGREIKKDEFHYGWQTGSVNMGVVAGVAWGGAPIFVATTTSGLAASMSLADKERVWAEIGAWTVQKRAERGMVVAVEEEKEEEVVVEAEEEVVGAVDAAAS